MSLAALPQPYREAIAFFQAFRLLGFSADDLYALYAGVDGRVQFGIVLRRDGAECVAIAGFLPDTKAHVVETWTQLATALTNGGITNDELVANWETSMAKAQFLALPTIVIGKGIALPSPPSVLHVPGPAAHGRMN